MTNFIGRNTAYPTLAFKGLKDGDSLHGLTDGHWSLTDAIIALLKVTGPANLVISTWTAGQADIRKAHRLLEDTSILSAKWLVDRSFQTRQPAYCRLLRERFGDDSVRIWNSHAKFVLVLDGPFDILYLTSANLNANKRLENYSIFAGGNLAHEYLELVQELFEMQKPGEGFEIAKIGRKHTTKILGRARDGINGRELC